NGDAYSRSHWVSYALGTIAASIVGTKGAGAVSKTGIATTKQAAKTGITKTKTAIQNRSVTDLLPYAPQHRLAEAGASSGIPHNTVNGAGLRDQLMTMAKKEGEVNRKADSDEGKGIDGDKSSLTPGGGLVAHEVKGGHLIERHVGKTDDELFQRLRSNPKITGSSTFNDRATAEKVANTVLNNPKNNEKIKKWLSEPNSRPTLLLRYKGDGEIIGRSVVRNSEVVENVTNAKIVLKKNNDGSFILTGYPVK
ncbi:RNase A-like domain-containing protein, partial [Bacillus gobiensis]|uniref:RNase A-like domain-containing protein n=1 Tax=Bacillus gobiensis TaxID=1441095 RepID=UPI003D25A8DC